jgi:hypothetical protein
MTRLAWFALAATLAALAGGCTEDRNSPFTQKDHPGYAPPGSKASADPRRTPAGFVP